MRTFQGSGDIDGLILSKRPLPRRGVGASRPECDPDRDNLATILAMATYVRDALTGAPKDAVTSRLENLRDCVAAAKQAEMLCPIVDPALEEMIAAVESVAAEQRFAAAAEAFYQDSSDLPSVPTAGMVSAGVQAGAENATAAQKIWRAMAAALSGAPAR